MSVNRIIRADQKDCDLCGNEIESVYVLLKDADCSLIVCYDCARVAGKLVGIDVER